MSDEIQLLLWQKILGSLELQAGMLVLVDDGQPLNCSVVSSGNVPVEPFNGSENYAVVDVIIDCIKRQPSPHEHAIGDLALANLVGRLGANCHKAAVATFLPISADESKMVFLGFPLNNKRDGGRVKRAESIVGPLVDYTINKSRLAYFERKLEYTELYIREIGHDLASNMQAVFGQLGTMISGNLTEKAMVTKATEVLHEVKNIYAIAESLDVTLDRGFAIHAVQKVDVAALFKQLAEEYEAEAREKSITISTKLRPSGLYVYADRKSLRLCLVHLLINAIKYSHDKTTVEVTGSFDKNEVRIVVTNHGVGVPRNEEALRIWEFGYRSKYAKERHVNGSGIGLYTAKRIVLAHGGRIWHEQHGPETRFTIAIPNP